MNISDWVMDGLNRALFNPPIPILASAKVSCQWATCLNKKPVECVLIVFMKKC